MKVTSLAIPEVKVFEPRIFEDSRGAFFESFSAKVFASETGLERDFVQDNHSVSKAGVLRGLHYQLAPHAQGKLVRVVKGAVFDVAVDLRKSSPTFGQWVGETLTPENRKQLWIPEGFGHGFLALSDDTHFLYKTTSFYHPGSDRSILWNDPDIGIAWPWEGEPVLSDKDKAASRFSAADVFA
jgi:dTDP-4-dehydrorhamnose 3,5-epimerase